MVVGISSLIDSVGNMIGFDTIALLGLDVYLLLAPFWMLAFGISLLRTSAAEIALAGS
jgi:hypothetical protein